MTRVDPLIHEQRVQTIRVQTLAGESAADIATRLGISPRTVTRHRAALGIAQSPGQRLTAVQEAQAQAMVEDGCSVAEIARTIGCSHGTITRRYPNAAWSRTEVADYATVCRAMRRAAA